MAQDKLPRVLENLKEQPTKYQVSSYYADSYLEFLRLGSAADVYGISSTRKRTIWYSLCICIESSNASTANGM